MGKEVKRDISSQVEFVSMAARLAKVTLNDKQAEFMFLVAELLIEKGEDTTIKEIKSLMEDTEGNIKKREAEKKLKKRQQTDKDTVWGGNAPTFIENHIDGIHSKLTHNGKEH